MPHCLCTFIQSGQPMDNAGCQVHTQEKYSCGQCACDNYRPRSAPIRRPDGDRYGQFRWAFCACGHCAQDHN